MTRGRCCWAAILLVLACCGARVAGVDGQALTVVQFLPTVVLVLLTPLLVDVELTPPSRGEADGAGGVATVLRVAADSGGALDHFDVWVLFTGAAKPFGLGLRRWLARHRNELDDERTVFVSIPAVGDGALHYSRREGPLYPLRSHSQLLGICADIAEDAGADGARRGRRYAHRATAPRRWRAASPRCRSGPTATRPTAPGSTVPTRSRASCSRGSTRRSARGSPSGRSARPVRPA